MRTCAKELALPLADGDLNGTASGATAYSATAWIEAVTPGGDCVRILIDWQVGQRRVSSLACGVKPCQIRRRR